MGWASASSIFNRVARAMVDLNAEPEMKRKVLGPLIDELRDGDWDTEDESMDEFRDDPVVVELFKQRLGTEHYANGVYGTVDFQDGQWVLRCDEHGVLGWGDGTAEEHDRLVREWVAHEKEQHGGDGVVEQRLLILLPGEVSGA